MLFFLLLIGIVRAQDYVVTTTADGGAGSLRYALQMCMTTTGPHTIRFNIPTTDAGYNASAGVWVITPTTVLPMVMQQNVTIDATTQTEFAGDVNPLGPEIVLDGGGLLDYGLRIFNAADAVVKGLNIRNFTKGIQVYNSPGCWVSSCYIGVNETASEAVPNDVGLEFIAGSNNALIGGLTAADRNVISGNQHIGVRLLDVTGCTVVGNYIGTDRSGTFAIPNYDGMSMEGAVQNCTIGGTTPEARNLISGNTDYGLPLFGVGATGNVIIGNYIGTDVTGTAAIGNTYGVLFDDGSFGNRVGGESPAERNVISGNVGYGVFFYNNGTHDNSLINNYIGTDYTGMEAIPNTAGIIIDGIAYQNVMDGNVISGNLQVGIGINITGSDGNVVVRNRIGVNVAGDPLPNGMDGIRISQGASQTIIGGTLEEGNIIAHNGGCGIYITSDNCQQNRISRNSFYQNGGLAIDLFAPGVNLNDLGDADNGANAMMNYPQIERVVWTEGMLNVSGFLDTEFPDDCEVQIYRAAVDVSGCGEGRDYLASVYPDNGMWHIALENTAASDLITAIAIDEQGNTSEFSATWGINGPVGIIPHGHNSYLTISPNPTQGVVSVHVSVPHTRICLLDINGRQIFSHITSDDVEWNLSNLSSGTHIVQVLNGSQLVATTKLVKE